jgi:cytochrome c-type biogenesis protein CcmF
MPYEGEHLLIGQIGHFVSLLALVSALVALVAYYKSARLQPGSPEADTWKKMARGGYIINAISVVSLFVILYLIIYNHYFEYKYAHQHSKRSLDMQYLLSCFWEGQEGSFMLWSFWNAVLGLVLLARAGKWEAPVMTFFSIAQVFLASFLMGIYFFDVRVGTSPFVLMRNEFPDAPVFRDPQYLFKYLTDGNGLNVLLQNYWMVIHPPVLFLGFASTLVPFSYSLAGLWTRDFKGWIKPALPWSLFSAGILGLGIMMGAAWAYESLTFGGYWAWDPVENASMVPWLLLVAGIHTMLIYKHTGHSGHATFLFLPLSFLLVLYSTFLTRTGVLGDTSVHSFTGEGNSLYWHLIVMMLLYACTWFLVYIRNRKAIPVEHREESMQSREFWMFVGSLLLLVSSLYIIVLTSLPFINKLFGTQWAIGQDVEYVYNRVMILVSFVIAILTALTQYLKYRDTPKKYFREKIFWPSLIALAISAFVSATGNFDYDKYGLGFLTAIHLALWAGIYTVIANAAYMFIVMRKNLKAAGASLSHLGFGLMLVGILVSSSKKELVSRNRTGIAVPGLKDAKGRDENPLENITLIHGVPTPMGNYTVTYLEDSTVTKDEKVFFKLNFRRTDTAAGRVLDEFNVYPNAFLMKGQEGMQLSSNPGAKHYLHKDIFVYITSWLNPDNIKDTASFMTRSVQAGDTMFYSNGFAVVDKVMMANKYDNQDLPVVDSAWLTEVTVFAKDGRSFKVQPAFLVKDNMGSQKLDTVISQSLVFNLDRRGKDEVILGMKESGAVMRYITLKAYSFPMINLLWLGTIVMTAGFLMSMFYRMRQGGRKVDS